MPSCVSQATSSVMDDGELSSPIACGKDFQTTVHMESILLAQKYFGTIWRDASRLEDRLLHHVGVSSEKRFSFPIPGGFGYREPAYPSQCSSQFPMWFLITNKAIYLIYSKWVNQKEMGRFCNRLKWNAFSHCLINYISLTVCKLLVVSLCCFTQVKFTNWIEQQFVSESKLAVPRFPLLWVDNRQWSKLLNCWYSHCWWLFTFACTHYVNPKYRE